MTRSAEFSKAVKAGQIATRSLFSIEGKWPAYMILVSLIMVGQEYWKHGLAAAARLSILFFIGVPMVIGMVRIVIRRQAPIKLGISASDHSDS